MSGRGLDLLGLGEPGHGGDLQDRAERHEVVVEQQAWPVGAAGSGAAPQHQLAAALDLAADAFLTHALLAR